MNPAGDADYSNEEIVNRIVRLTVRMTDFWASPRGWAPIESAHLLSKSRLDWQASLSRQLRLFLTADLDKESGALILGWVTLGSLVEGTLKLFLSVWYHVYKAQNLSNELKAVKDKSGKLIDPDVLVFEKLRVFFQERVFPKNAKAIWNNQGEIDWNRWLLRIQQRRNAIHAFRDRDIGSSHEFHTDVKQFLIFLRKVNGAVPYPDDGEIVYRPLEI
jgi:hypothetical protein